MKLIIPRKIYAQVDFYVQNSPIEVSWLGKLVKKDANTFEVASVHLVEQENTATSTDLDAKAVAKLMYAVRELPGTLSWWGHSHVNMPTEWSAIDHNTMKILGGHGFIVSTVFNKKRSFKTAYFQGGTDFYPSIFVDNIETNIADEVDKSLEDSWKKELDEKCKQRVWTMTDPGIDYIPKHKSWWDDDDDDNSWYRKRKPKLKKEKRNKKKSKITNDEQDCETLLRAVLTQAQLDNWREYQAVYLNTDPNNISWAKLWTFYTSYDGVWADMEADVIARITVDQDAAMFDDADVYTF